MALDAVFLKALVSELNGRLAGARVDKVQQPEPDSVLLSLRAHEGNIRLFISARQGSARLNVTGRRFENPDSPPMFCMLLRKHLSGARILSVTQPENERLAYINIEAPDEMGVLSEKKLIVEMMGRGTNIVLTDASGRVTDSLRRVGSAVSEGRSVLPGLYYAPPPQQDRPCFFGMDGGKLRKLVEEAPEGMTADKWLLSTFSGLSPLICREICFRAVGDVSPAMSELDEAGKMSLRISMEAIIDSVRCGELVPFMLKKNGRPQEFSFMPIKQYGGEMNGEVRACFSELLDEFYVRREEADSIRRRSQDLNRAVKTARDRLTRRLGAQREELARSGDREKYRRSGDLITANMYRLTKGLSEFETEDFYEDGCPQINISLDPLKTPQQNASAYYRAYNKAKSAEEHLTRLIADGDSELEYLDSVADELERAASGRDLSDIRAELVQSGYIREQSKDRRSKQQSAGPMRFISSSGLEILVGRNNAQNDILTLKTAVKSDVWLHTQKIHGSHVIIRCCGTQPDEQTLTEAASLAAFYSQGRNSAKVPVDYTQVRFVKKPNGARPGMVIYTDYRTVLAEPSGELAENLAAK